jgi:hypothetical protein
VADLPPGKRREVLDLVMENRGRHDDLLRDLRSGYALKFDILMDLGAFRDLHRHRRCIQILQGLTPEHRYDDPETTFLRGLADAGAAQKARERGVIARYQAALDSAGEAVQKLRVTNTRAANYALPLAFRTRALFKMDLAEAAYICEQRTAVAGHFSYRHVAWQMHQELKSVSPTLAAHIRATDPNRVVDLLSR